MSHKYAPESALQTLRFEIQARSGSFFTHACIEMQRGKGYPSRRGGSPLQLLDESSIGEMKETPIFVH